MADWSQYREEPIEVPQTLKSNPSSSDDKWAQYRDEPISESKYQDDESIFASPKEPHPESEQVKNPIKSAIRSGLQIPAGLAKVLTFPADIVKALGVADALQEFQDLKDRGIVFDEEKYMQGLEDAAKMFPTQERAEELLEEHAGIPLKAKTAKQKQTRLASEFFGFLNPLKEIKGASFRPPQRPSPPEPPNMAADIIGPNAPGPFESGQAGFEASRVPPPPHPQTAPRGTTDQSHVFEQMRQRTRPVSLRGRVTPQESRQLGIQRPSHPRNPTVQDRVLGTFQNESYNSQVTGNATRNNFIQQSDRARQRVTHLYDEASGLNSSFEDIRPDVVESYLNRIAEIDSLPAPSTVQESMRREMQQIVNQYAQFDANGNVIAYRRVPNQQVLNQAKALRSRIDSDFMHGNAGNEFIPVIEDLTNSSRRAAVAAEAPEAVQALDEANGAFIDWTNTYNNKLVRNIRKGSNQKPIKTFESLTDMDNFNIARPILEETPQGQALLESYQRKIADKKLEKFYDMPRAQRTRKLDETLRELESVLTEDQITAIRNQFNARETPEFPGNASRVQRAPEPELNRVQTARTNEQLNRLMNERSGIIEVRNTVPEPAFDRMVQTKTKDILFKGKHEANPTAAEIRDILNITKNRELMVEMHGEEVVDEIYSIAKTIAAEEEAALAAKEAKALSQKEIKEKWRSRLKTTKKALMVAKYIGVL